MNAVLTTPEIAGLSAEWSDQLVMPRSGSAAPATTPPERTKPERTVPDDDPAPMRPTVIPITQPDPGEGPCPHPGEPDCPMPN